MSFSGMRFELSYNNQECDVIHEFLNPALKQAVEYDRAVGFFSSTALMAVSIGIENLVKNGGRIKIICSPKLSSEDVEAIKQGYEEREIIEESLKREFYEPKNSFESERLNILSHLISDGILDIKIATLKTLNPNSMFHVKLGVLIDENNNYIAFNGSMNDSENAFYGNAESIDVFNSLGSEYMRANEKKKYFDSLWSNEAANTSVLDFPESLKERINHYMKSSINWDIDKEELGTKTKKNNKPAIPSYISVRTYQKEAYENWQNNNFCGIYDMATGTGKTYTALYSMVNILNEKKGKLAIIICCPYQHLVNQWTEDLEEFGFEYIVGFSGSPQKNWKKRLENSIFDYNHGIKNSICFITTNASFSGTFVQTQISKISKEVLIVIDEAHNFGTSRLVKLLDDRFKYRLALSATLDRYNDLVGTERLYTFFGKKCIEYTLERAIESGMLCKYYYYPIKVYLDEEELEKYSDLSREISKCIIKNPDGSIEYSKKAEMLLIKRSRIVAATKMKLIKLMDIAKKYVNDNHLLIYCGATTVVDNDYEEGKATDEEIRQIDAVSKLLQEIGIKSAQFTSEEDSHTRELLKREFDDGDVIQALVAIRCLDEGVNIPSIDKAIILASSTNPKEYIQRRGRVLRTYKGKEFAVIYDFVTLPRRLEEITPMTDLDLDYGLIRREFKRVKDFASLSQNEYQSSELIEEIESKYGRIEGDNYD